MPALEHDYEVTGIELDTLAHTAWQQEGVLGARMTGAGFGGCGIAIVAKDKVDEFIKAHKDIKRFQLITSECKIFKNKKGDEIKYLTVDINY